MTCANIITGIKPAAVNYFKVDILALMNYLIDPRCYFLTVRDICATMT